MPFLATKGSRVLEKKVNETEASKTVFSHLNYETFSCRGRLEERGDGLGSYCFEGPCFG